MMATQILFVSSTPSPPLPDAAEPTRFPLDVIDERAGGQSGQSERETTSGSEMTLPEGDESESPLEWNDWIKNYAAGSWSGKSQLTRPTIPRPALPNHLSSSSAHQSPSPLASPSLVNSPTSVPIPSRETDSNRSNSSHLEIFASSTLPGENKVPRISLEERTPEKLLDFYQEHGYLPAPPGEHEEQRLLMLRKFGLLESCRRENIDRLCRMVKVHFKTSRVAITLVLSEHTILAAEAGWGDSEPGPDEPPREVPIMDSLCAHSITRSEETEECFVVNDASKDWRFKENPSVVNQGPLQFYASANINLPSTSAVTPALPVGSICLIDNKPREVNSFTVEDSSLLKDMADLIARELLLGYETTRREHEAKQAKYLGEFLVSANSTIIFPSSGRSHASPATTASLHTPSSSENGTETRLFQAAAEQLRELTSARSACILDLRSFHHLSNRPTGEPVSQISFTDGGVSGSFASRAAAASQICSLGAAGDTIDWDDMIMREEGQAALSRAVRESLDLFKISGATAFESGTNDNPFAAILPLETEAYCLVPVFDYDGSAALFLVITSDEKHFRFELADQRFCQNVAVVCLSSLMRAKAFEADRAKLAFVSAISHELRTPLHGVSSQVELIREFSSPKERARLAPLLECAEICLESLRDVLDDTLDFAKLSNGSTPENRRLGHKRVNLETLLQDVCLATWVRRRRVDLVSSDSSPAPIPQRVNVILEIEQRSAGWEATVDVGALKRVLLNVLGNALKFTTAGEVKVTLREVATSREERQKGRRMVSFEIADTGIGMSNDFLRNGKAFLPFVQEDAFANGTGLGLSICDRIIRQNGGTIDIASKKNVGTCVLITLPLDLLATAPVSTTSSTRSAVDDSPLSTIRRPSSRPRTAGFTVPTFHTRIISDELGALFNPSPGLLQGATPPFECKEFNFTRAIEVAKASSARAETAEESPTTTDSDTTAISSPMTPSTSLGSTDDNSSTIGSAAPKSLAPNIRCLLAEDNAISRKILCRLLDWKGIDYVQAADGQEAIDAFKQGAGSFQIILLDVQMPIKDGLEAAFEIRAHEKLLGLTPSRIVALTGLSNPNTAVNGIINFWLVKGGKSLRTILDEIVTLQTKHDAAHSLAIPTPTRPRLVASS